MLSDFTTLRNKYHCSVVIIFVIFRLQFIPGQFFVGARDLSGRVTQLIYRLVPVNVL